ncbi:MAG: hypothetical protein K2X01_12095 [Cyanobacteria bacterium]|nr:hypothetical protein [Cyanobacteriota bacterium]
MMQSNKSWLLGWVSGVLIFMGFGLIWSLQRIDAQVDLNETQHLAVQQTLKKALACEGGKIVSKFTEEDSGDSVRSDPEPSFHGLLSAPDNTHKIASYQSVLCVTKDGTEPVRHSIEALQLKNGTAIILENSGWEYVTLSYQVILPQDKHSPSDVAYWKETAAYWMNQAASMQKKESQALSMTQETSKAIMTHKMSMYKLPLTVAKTDGMTYETQVSGVKALTKESEPGRVLEIVTSIGPL